MTPNSDKGLLTLDHNGLLTLDQLRDLPIGASVWRVENGAITELTKRVIGTHHRMPVFTVPSARYGTVAVSWPVTARVRATARDAAMLALEQLDAIRERASRLTAVAKGILETRTEPARIIRAKRAGE